MSIKKYILNNSHIFPFDFEGKIWLMYYPGYEGIYAIALDGHVLSLERKILQVDAKLYPVKQKLLKPLPKKSKNGSITYTFNLYKESTLGKPKTVTINQTLKIINDMNAFTKKPDMTSFMNDVKRSQGSSRSGQARSELQNGRIYTNSPSNKSISPNNKSMEERVK